MDGQPYRFYCAYANYAIRISILKSPSGFNFPLSLTVESKRQDRLTFLNNNSNNNNNAELDRIVEKK